jgi:hypothetical protein
VLQVMEVMSRPDVIGASVTIPLKEDMYVNSPPQPCMQSPAAARCKAPP